MATIAQITLSDAVTTFTPTTLTGTDDLTVKQGTLYIMNDSGGAVTITIDGSGASATVYVRGVGIVDATGGYSTGSIANGDTARVDLGAISEFLVGTVAVTGGAAGVLAWIE